MCLVSSCSSVYSLWLFAHFPLPPCPSLPSSPSIFRSQSSCPKAGTPPRSSLPSATSKGFPSHAIQSKRKLQIIKSVVIDLKAFVDFHYDLYQDCPYDVPTLFSDDMNTLSPEKNAAFDFCDAEYYLAYKDGKLAGRVAAIINKRANQKWGRQSVRFGWIDFIDDIEVSTALLKAVEDFGRQHGMKEVVGPLGFTDMDPEGMLTWGFDKLGTMATIYNYPYYPQHIEQMGGWEKDNDYVEYYMNVPDKVPEKYTRIAELVESRYNLHVKKLTRREVLKENYGKKLFDIINRTYGDLYGFVSLTDKTWTCISPWPTSTW